MARSTFGGTDTDILLGTAPDGALHYTSGVLTFWDAEAGGSQHTSLLLPPGGSAVTSIPVGADGQVPPFQGPDGVTSMWADAGGDGGRVLILARTPPIVVVPTGTTGYATQPDGTLWIEYTP